MALKIIARVSAFLRRSWFLSVFLIQPAIADLVPSGAQWKYLDDGSELQSLWQLTDFDDSNWSSGPAPLGYGDGDESTVVSYGPDSANKHITTYFRHQFSLTTLPADPLKLGVQRDDGVVVYLNGTEIFRNNMPDGVISAGTLASTAVAGAAESSWSTSTIYPESFLLGVNTLAVEIHQVSQTSSDISFDLQISDDVLVRGPYLQQSSSSGITVRWRTVSDRDSVLKYGTEPQNLDQIVSSAVMTTNHEVTLSSLEPDTRYFYGIGTSSGDFTATGEQYFDTHPITGEAAPTRIWVLGDSGTANTNAAAVRDSYISVNEGAHSDVWLMLGDNAYNDGTDDEYQVAVFDMYPQTLSNSVLWSTLGNHDGRSADSTSQSGVYYDIFTFPGDGESGGVASGTEAYYSFDYANIHFVSLDSYESDRSANGAMATWLQNDLAANTQEWIIAFWHHPPYSKGSHDSDTEQPLIEMRTNFLPILEYYGVDLVLGGHSHSYERSMLIEGHYGSSDTFSSTHQLDAGNGAPSGDGAYNKAAGSNNGSVYVVAGSSGKLTNAPLDHPVMVSNLLELGSMVIDVNGNQLDAKFINSSAAVTDSFQIIHEATSATPPNAPSGLTATASTDTEVHLNWKDNADNEESNVVERSIDQSLWTVVATLDTDSTSFVDTALNPETSYTYRVVAMNVAGSSPPSNTASATTLSTPEFVDYFATLGSTISGTVSGSLDAIEENDEFVQAITEGLTGGKPTKRRSMLEHSWQFQVQTGGTAMLYANAYSSGSIDGDAFDFDYSTDGGLSWHRIFTIGITDSKHEIIGLLPAGVQGTVLIRVADTDRTQGNSARDTIFVDELRIRVVSGVDGTPPAAPSGLTASVASATSISLSWSDNASDEIGFEVQRRNADSDSWSLLETVGPDSSNVSDLTAIPGVEYVYRVQAFNGSGVSGYSNTVSAGTPAGSMSLTVSARKIKGSVHGILSWTSDPAGLAVTVYRNNTHVAGVYNANSYTDNTRIKRGGTFNYKVCKVDAPSDCSNEATIAF